MARLAILVQAVLATAIFYLGYNIYSFTTSITTIVDRYPQVLNDVNQLTDKIKVEQWLELARTFEVIAPQAVQVVSDINTNVAAANNTVASIDKKIPAILTEVKALRSETIPQVLAEVKQLRNQTVPDVLSEVKAVRTQTLPPLLLETKLIRQQLPPILVQVNEIVDKSKEISEQATKGAVKGVIMSPIDLIRDAGDQIKSTVTEGTRK